MKAIIFESSDDLIEQVMAMERDVETEHSCAERNDDDYYRGIYAESMDEIKKYHTDYPYLQKTKKFACYIV